MADSCTLALSKGGTGAVQVSMNTLSRERFCMLMVRNRMNQDEPCTDMYIHCTAIVQTCIYKTNFIFLSLYPVQIRYIHVLIVFTLLNYIHVCVYTCLDLVHRMYIPGTYMECTSSCVYVQRIQKQKVS